ncbi:MAG: formyltransferase family protein [Longimicrobiaceae bacterium]
MATAEEAGPRFAFAGDRDVAVEVLRYLLEQGHRPSALLLSGAERASHADALAAACPFLPPEAILRGTAFREPAGLCLLRRLELDWIVGIHFPYLVPTEVLAVPRQGVLNLHPALLPWNRGWHTPTWALLEGTPAGATLHFMDAGFDTGDVVLQRPLEPRPCDTADTLYGRIRALEVEVFREAWPTLVDGSFRRTPQPVDVGTAHRRRDLFSPEVQRIDPDARMRAGDLLLRLRALTTSRWDEAAYFEAGGTRYRVQVAVREDPFSNDSGLS